jgi:hypothetical protein
MSGLPALSKVGVIHLVRAANGLSPLASFLESLRSHVAGRDYDLVLVLKGFVGETLPREYENLLDAHRHERLFMPDVGFDIGAYFFAAGRVAHQRVCFLNSYSRILHRDWLRFFDEALTQPGIGVVGATGSAETARGAPGGTHVVRSVAQVLSPRLLYRALAFPEFPNYHLRSNAFYISRQLFLSLVTGPLRTKRALYRFESGRQSMTRQLAARGLAARVIGRDGVAYPPHEWSASATFRSGEQENLLVADNRTMDYEMANAQRRQMLTEAAWGPSFTTTHARAR